MESQCIGSFYTFLFIPTFILNFQGFLFNNGCQTMEYHR